VKVHRLKSWGVWVSIFYALPFSVVCLCAAPEPPPLISAEKVREMPPEQAAREQRVRLRGAVTFFDPQNDIGLFLQDATGAIFIKLGEGVVTSCEAANVHAGDEVEVEGITKPGDYLPVVFAEHVRVLGAAEFPRPEHFSYEQLVGGKGDCQWIELQGVVRSVSPTASDRGEMALKIDGQRLPAEVKHLDLDKARGLVGGTVRIQGVCRTRFNNKRQICAPYVSVSSLANVVLEVPPESEISKVALKNLARFDFADFYGRRVEVQGIVTERNENSLIIQNGDTGLYIKTVETNRVTTGDCLAAIGFPTPSQYAPSLEDATLRVIGHSSEPAPAGITVEQLPSENYENLLVRVHSRLMNRIERANEEILTLEAPNLIVNARLPLSRSGGSLSSLQKGSLLELTGVCRAVPVENWNPALKNRSETFEIWLRSADDVRVLQNPPWWTFARLLWALVIVGAVLLAGFAWVFELNRKVRKQTVTIQQKVEREAILEERTRLAREFHDSLEQELAAIMIQLETVAAQFDAAPNAARQMLQLAHNMVRRSLVEARRSVWDLRSHLLENSNLVTAIGELARSMAANTQVAIPVETFGKPRKLPLQIENNLLRIVQEALTNALKHARARKISLRLNYTHVRMSVRVIDDGIGFDPNDRSLPWTGHFGLLDMRERAVKMNARLEVTSIPCKGTEILVEVSEKGMVFIPAGAGADSPEKTAAV
jgi:signal transduction histidine kinase